MGVRRSHFALGLTSLLSLCLVLLLHACQSAPLNRVNAADPGPTLATPASAPSPTPLPPATQAIVATAGPNGMVQPPRGDVRLAVISDLNSAYGSVTYDPEVTKAVQLLPFWNPTLVLCSGDMVAGQDPRLSVTELNAMWAGFDKTVAAPLRQMQLPFGFTVGNHDASSARGSSGNFLFQQERDIAKAYWQDPAHAPGVQFIDRNDFPFYYTFESNEIFFLVWDGSSSQIPAAKLAWVEQALASEKAQSAKLRILIGHLPLYAVAVDRDQPGDVMDNADTVRSLLEKYNVHTYISGHHHAYYPGYRGALQLLHTGLLGSGARPLLSGSLAPGKTLTIIDVNFADPALTTYTTYDMKTLQVIPISELPRTIVGHNGMVVRRDIPWSSLTPAEQAACKNQLGQARCQA